MHSTPRMDARKKFRYYRGKRAGIRQKQRILSKIWPIESQATQTHNWNAQST